MKKEKEGNGEELAFFKGNSIDQSALLESLSELSEENKGLKQHMKKDLSKFKNDVSDV